MLAPATDAVAAPCLLEAHGLCLEGGGKRLIDAVSFGLPHGGITAIIGPNGAGKSLLLRLCHGLIQPSAGHVAWAGGAGITHSTPRQAMVFQQPVMLRRSVLANVEHALGATGMGGMARSSHAMAALERFGLAALARQPARLISGGEQQRLAIARAWALKPEVIFLDEPCSQLDPGATRQIEQMLLQLVADGITLVMATHDLAQARRLARQVLFLNRGKLVESGDAASFFATPQTLDARHFIAGELLW